VNWVSRAVFIVVGAPWVLLTAGVFAWALRRPAERDRAALAWFVTVRGLPGALFIAAGLTGSFNVVWAAAAVLVAGFVVGPIFKRIWPRA